MKILIIGGIATGLKSAAKARRENRDAEITVFEKGDLVSYGSCGMPYYVGGEIEDINELMSTGSGKPRDPEYFKKTKGFEVETRTEVLSIDRSVKTIQIQKKDTGEIETRPYDKLIIATGASPVKPSLEGTDLENIFTLWHPADAVRIRSGIDQGKYKNAVIIGAGLIGIEMVEAFKKQGLNVTVVEMKEQLFPAFLDTEVAALAEKYLIEQGVQLLLGEKVEKFGGEGQVSFVQTDKREIPADLVVLAIGAKPNIKLAKEAGLKIGETGAIWVDEEMRTSDPDIFAGGDCVENTHLLTRKKVYAPMGSTANKHGRVIGENLFGKNDRFRGVLNTVVVKAMEMNIGKTGLSEKEAKALGYEYVSATVSGPDKAHYMEDSEYITLKLIAEVDSRKLLGIQGIGKGEIAKRIDVVAGMLTLGGTIDDLFDVDISYAPPYNIPIDTLAAAANAVVNKLEERFQGIISVDAKELMGDKGPLFLDVRTLEECVKSGMTGCACAEVKNIPLSELRDRLQELPKEDEIVVVCQSGQRGYEAARILSDHGFGNVKTLEGGLEAWPFK